MHIYYLHHSAVCAVFDSVLLIFDYYMFEPRKRISDGYIDDSDIKNAENVYVFVSHSHHDHYNPRIYDWAEINPNVTYILDATVPEPDKSINAVILSPGEAYEDGYLQVQEFGSTDIGGSFLAECKGTSLFHAGDLNFWHWKDEGDEDYTRKMEKYFARELKFLNAEAGHIDYAFFPVDKRMGSDYDEGADIFINTIRPANLIPIHFVDFGDTKVFRNKHIHDGTNIFSIQKNGQRLV